MGELERDEAAPDEDDPLGQRIQIEEPIAGRDVLGAGERERLRGRIGDPALDPHPRGPVDRDPIGVDALVGQRARGVNGLGGGHQDLLRHAAAERARAAERPRVDDRDRPSRRAAA